MTVTCQSRQPPQICHRQPPAHHLHAALSPESAPQHREHTLVAAGVHASITTTSSGTTTVACVPQQ
ncbi:hypothetical protein DEO72_LG11g1527 [Vigna unguiculata]|uniref:Uncharacterized protein n=1 Tax=Vigna unguiculata TaxID=3917 RepID=A0A4D6NLK8_VIGUN|nr:hypothetical protein DEO72_LG11g1527 [Vigna unguiculata]